MNLLLQERANRKTPQKLYKMRSWKGSFVLLRFLHLLSVRSLSLSLMASESILMLVFVYNELPFSFVRTFLFCTKKFWINVACFLKRLWFWFYFFLYNVVCFYLLFNRMSSAQYFFTYLICYLYIFYFFDNLPRSFSLICWTIIVSC